DGNQISAQLANYAGIAANQVILGARTGGANDNHWIDDLDLKGFPYDSSSVEAGQVVTFQTSNNNPSLFSAQPALSPDGTLTFTPAPNAFGQATVSVIASDNGGTACEGRNTSQAQTFVIDIGPTPDRPVANSQSV